MSREKSDWIQRTRAIIGSYRVLRKDIRQEQRGEGGDSQRKTGKGGETSVNRVCRERGGGAEWRVTFAKHLQ